MTQRVETPSQGWELGLGQHTLNRVYLFCACVLLLARAVLFSPPSSGSVMGHFQEDSIPFVRNVIKSFVRYIFKTFPLVVSDF